MQLPSTNHNVYTLLFGIFSRSAHPEKKKNAATAVRTPKSVIDVKYYEILRSVDGFYHLLIDTFFFFFRYNATTSVRYRRTNPAGPAEGIAGAARVRRDGRARHTPAEDRVGFFFPSPRTDDRFAVSFVRSATPLGRRSVSPSPRPFVRFDRAPVDYCRFRVSFFFFPFSSVIVSSFFFFLFFVRVV